MERGVGSNVIDKGKEGERWRQIKKKESMKDAEKKRERVIRSLRYRESCGSLS